MQPDSPPIHQARTAGRAVSEFNDGDFPRGDPAEYFIEVDDDQAGYFIPALVDAQPAWRRKAGCRDQPLSIFFPARGQSSKPALAVCSSCPVRAECLAEATDEELEVGIRGGLTARARVAAGKAQAVTETEAA